MNLIQTLKEYKEEVDLNKKIILREKFMKQLSVDLISCAFNKVNLEEYYKQLIEGIMKIKTEEYKELQDSFDKIRKILF